jgi:hypothetical protein
MADRMLQICLGAMWVLDTPKPQSQTVIVPRRAQTFTSDSVAVV